MKGLEQDRIVLRELAQKAAEIAFLPVQEEKKRLWRRLNGLKPEDKTGNLSPTAFFAV